MNKYVRDPINRVSCLSSYQKYNQAYALIPQNFFEPQQPNLIVLTPQQKQQIQYYGRLCAAIRQTTATGNELVPDFLKSRSQKDSEDIVRLNQALAKHGILPTEIKQMQLRSGALPIYVAILKNNQLIVLINHDFTQQAVLGSPIVQFEGMVVSQIYLQAAQAIMNNIRPLIMPGIVANFAGISHGGSIAAICSQMAIKEMHISAFATVYGPVPCVGLQTSQEMAATTITVVYDNDQNAVMSNHALRALQARCNLIERQQAQKYSEQISYEITGPDSVFLPGYIVWVKEGKMLNVLPQQLAEMRLNI